jgi:hypothetical protein
MRRTPLILSLLLMWVASPGAWAATAPSATYESIRDLKGYRPLAFEPWSPSGRYLGMIGRKGELRVWDAGQPEQSPRVVARHADELARWSPDGGWLLFEGLDKTESHCLIAVRLSDASRDTFPFPLAWPYLWASDGRIYGWTGGPQVAIEQPHDHWLKHRVVAGPPKLWSSDHPGPNPGKAVLFSSFGFLPGPKPTEWDLAINRDPAVKYVILESAFPGDSLFLAIVGGSTAASSRNCVMDLRGNVIREIKDPNEADVGGCMERADWNSVSADGKYLIGAREKKHWPFVNGEPHSIVYVGDTRGQWSTPVRGALEGAGPRWAPNGYEYCAEDHIAGVLRVGRIRFERAGSK